MLKSEVRIGSIYIAKISGRLALVRLDAVAASGRGYAATNLDTHRQIRIKSPAKLRREVSPEKVTQIAELHAAREEERKQRLTKIYSQYDRLEN